MRYYTIDKIDFGGGIKAILPKKIRVRRSDDSTQQYMYVLYALLKQIPNLTYSHKILWDSSKHPKSGAFC